MRLFLKKVTGILLVLVGCIGLILPIIPGIVLIIAGLGMLGQQNWAHDLARRFLRKKRPHHCHKK